MSSTRYAATAEASDASPEKFLASGKLRGIQIGLNVITRVARVRTERERSCMIWLHNYARLQNLTADALSEELDLSKPEIRTALTDPDADLTRFVRQVSGLRTQFEESLGTVVATEPAAIVREGLSMALKRRKIVEIVGLTRMGKTAPALEWFRRNAMDRGVYFNCPHDESDRNFIWEFARALGIGVGTGKKTCQIIPQIRACLGKGMIELIVVDEGHFLWPADPKAKPKRLECLRSCYDIHNPAQIGVAVITTPQHTLSMNLATGENKRWAPGQWQGRAIPFHLADTMSDADLRAVARHHAPDFEGVEVRIPEVINAAGAVVRWKPGDMLDLLVNHAKASHGFCGAMVNAIELAREKAELRGLKKVTPDVLLAAQKQMVAGTKIAQLAKVIGERSDGRGQLTERRAA